ncbi:uncharacterized protein [Watersipora subatra]|uniref:uncharacterized protein isoform X2 n=1 Tax=Watersipora subatra TaxID=2589382 RepID=UPI00355B3F72
MSLSFTALCCCLVSVAVAYPSGAGTQACENVLTPAHSNGLGIQIPKQTSTSPYEVIVSVEGGEDGSIPLVYGGDVVEVKLVGPNHFQGFILAAISMGDDGEEFLVGEFQVDTENENYAQTMCEGTAITHTLDWRNSAETELTFYWISPEQVFTGDVTFHATFVKEFDTFWVNVLSDTSVGVGREMSAFFIPPQEEDNFSTVTDFERRSTDTSFAELTDFTRSTTPGSTESTATGSTQSTTSGSLENATTSSTESTVTGFTGSTITGSTESAITGSTESTTPGSTEGIITETTGRITTSLLDSTMTESTRSITPDSTGSTFTGSTGSTFTRSTGSTTTGFPVNATEGFTESTTSGFIQNVTGDFFESTTTGSFESTTSDFVTDADGNARGEATDT